MQGVSLRSGEQLVATLPYTRRVLREMGFVNITHLPMGDEIFTPPDYQEGLWATDGKVIVAYITNGECWIACVDDNDPNNSVRQEQAARDACHRGIGGEIPNWEMIPGRYLLLRMADPDYDPQPRPDTSH